MLPSVTPRRLRQLAIAGSLVLLALFSVLSVLARVRTRAPAGPAGVPAPLAVGTELQRPRPIPSVTLADDLGRSVSTRSWRGKWVVLAPSMTLCHEVCPMTSVVLTALSDELRRAGLTHQVVVAEVTVDPWRDTPARLHAYRRLARADFTLLTGTQDEIHRLWRFLGVLYKRVRQGRPPDVDWLTNRPERFDVEHTDGVFFIDPHGQERIISVGMPSVGGTLPVALRPLLNDNGRQNLAHPELPWTATEALDDLFFLMGRNVPAGSTETVAAPTGVVARRALVGSPAALASLHDQAGRLLGAGSALASRIASLRGYPIVLNAWASWCGACRAEFSVFASEAARYGRKVAFLGVDTNDGAPDARAFLARHPISYPSYQSSSTQLSRWSVLEGMPTTVYISRTGKVIGAHIGQYATAAALDNDIEHYALGISG